AARALSIPLISGVILAFCTPITILKLQRVCRTSAEAVRDYLTRAFDVRRVLERFFPDVLAFRSLQARTGTLISGSVALQFFDRDSYPDSDLNLYVHMRHRREIGRWFLAQGYQFEPASHQPSEFEAAATEALSGMTATPYGMPGIAAVMNFTRRCDPRADMSTYDAQNESKLKVQLIVARKTPMEVVLGFHSTCVMNVISFEKAYCLFPRATLEERVSLLSSSSAGRSNRRRQSVAKYATRGFAIIERIPSTDLRSPSLFALGWRWIDDSSSWVIALNTRDVAPPASPNRRSPPLVHDPVVVCNWEVQYTPLRGAVMHYVVARSELLRYRYLIGDPDLAGELGRHFAAKLLQERFKKKAELDVWQFHDHTLPDLCRALLAHLTRRKLSCMRSIAEQTIA
ncbi:hypothetical protein K466DRAFT_500003, partial [Polyporus arcularius HHB13444]